MKLSEAATMSLIRVINSRSNLGGWVVCNGVWADCHMAGSIN